MADLYCVARELLADTWPIVRPLFAKVYDRGGDYTAHELLEAVAAQRMQLWVAADAHAIYAAAVTELMTSPRDKTCTIVACGGTGRKGWLHLIEKIEAFAKVEGCDRMLIIGRKGWKRVLPDYKEISVTIEKRIHP